MAATLWLYLVYSIIIGVGVLAYISAVKRFHHDRGVYHYVHDPIAAAALILAAAGFMAFATMVWHDVTDTPGWGEYEDDECSVFDRDADACLLTVGEVREVCSTGRMFEETPTRTIVYRVEVDGVEEARTARCRDLWF